MTSSEGWYFRSESFPVLRDARPNFDLKAVYCTVPLNQSWETGDIPKYFHKKNIVSSKFSSFWFDKLARRMTKACDIYVTSRLQSQKGLKKVVISNFLSVHCWRPFLAEKLQGLRAEDARYVRKMQVCVFVTEHPKCPWGNSTATRVRASIANEVWILEEKLLVWEKGQHCITQDRKLGVVQMNLRSLCNMRRKWSESPRKTQDSGVHGSIIISKEPRFWWSTDT